MSWWMLTFARRGPARYLSHLDTARVVQRTFARAGVPIALSEGMRPKPRLSLPLPLPVGAEGADELAVVEVPDECPLSAASLRLLREAAPPGFHIERLVDAGERRPHPRALTARYACSLEADAGAVARAVERYEDAETAVVERVSPKGRRTLDLKDYVADAVAGAEGTGTLLGFTVRYREDGAARPQEFVDLIAGWAEVDPVMDRLSRDGITWEDGPPASDAGGERRVSS